MRNVLMIVTALVMSGWVISPAYAEKQKVTSQAKSEAYDPLGKVEISHSRKLIQDHRKSIVSLDTGLTLEEEKLFWPIYDDYRSAMKKANDDLVSLILEYKETRDSGKLTDKHAINMISRSLKIRQAKLKIKNAFIKTFNKVISGKKVARFYQVEHRLDIIDEIEISDAVPLVDVEEK